MVLWSRAPVRAALLVQADREQQERQQEEETVGNPSLSCGSGQSERRKLCPVRQNSGGGIRHELGNGTLGMFQLFSSLRVNGMFSDSTPTFYGKVAGREALTLSFVCGSERLPGASCDLS